jgi:hypothetical protein
MGIHRCGATKNDKLLIFKAEFCLSREQIVRRGLIGDDAV